MLAPWIATSMYIHHYLVLIYLYVLFKGVESGKVEEVTGSPIPTESGARANRPTHCVVGGAHAFILRVRSPAFLCSPGTDSIIAGRVVGTTQPMLVEFKSKFVNSVTVYVTLVIAALILTSGALVYCIWLVPWSKYGSYVIKARGNWPCNCFNPGTYLKRASRPGEVTNDMVTVPDKDDAIQD